MYNILNLALVHLALSLLAAAAPTEVTTQAEPWQAGTGGGIVGFVVLVLDIIAWVEIIQSNRTPMNKLVWCLVVFLFPVVGMFIYYIFSERAKHNSAGYEAIPS